MSTNTLQSGTSSSLVDWQKWTKPVLLALGYSLLGLGLLTVDIFGFNKVSQRFSEMAFYNVFAPQYGKPPFAPPVPESDIPAEKPVLWNRNISVILLDDKALKKNDKSNVVPGGIGWPAPMKYHVKLLTDLYETFKPAVIMVDILFFDKREKDELALNDLVKLLIRINADPDTHLYLAAIDPDQISTKVIDKLAKVTNLVAIGWPVNDETNLLHYPLAVGAGFRSRRELNGIHPSVAYKIYRDLCDQHQTKKWDGLNCPVGGANDESFERSMQVFWGINAPALNWEQYNLGIICSGQALSPVRRFGNFVWASIKDSTGFTENAIEGTRETCPYLQFLRARDFMDPDFRNDPHNGYEVKRTLNNALGSKKNAPPKVIFYGASFEGADDKIWSPTHGKVPGVFMHAMALDNLLTLGDRYIREARLSDPMYLFLNWLVALLVAVIAMVARFYLRTGGGSWNTKLRVYGMSIILVLSIILGAMYVSFFLFRFAPINWLGFLGVIFIIRAIQSERFEKVTRSVFVVIIQQLRITSRG